MTILLTHLKQPVGTYATGTSTGDETTATINTKLTITTLPSVNH